MEGAIKVRAVVRAVLLDGVRFTQDLGRGGTDPVTTSHGVGTGYVLLSVAAAVLADATLTADGLRGLDAEVGQLIATEPHVREGAWALRLSAILDAFAAPLMPAGWAPPGGWPPESNQMTVTAQVAEVSLYALRTVVDAEAQACPVGATAGACMRAWDALDARLAAEARELPENLAERQRQVLDEEVTREQALGIASRIMAAVAGPPMRKYARRQGMRVINTAVLRLFVRIRQHLAEGGACPPTSVDLAHGSIAEAAADPWFGGKLRVEVAGGRIRVAPNGHLELPDAGEEGPPPVIAELVCP